MYIGIEEGPGGAGRSQAGTGAVSLQYVVLRMSYIVCRT